MRLHPDGNSARSTMLVINGTPVGFLSWEALDAIESQDTLVILQKKFHRLVDFTGNLLYPGRAYELFDYGVFPFYC